MMYKKTKRKRQSNHSFARIPSANIPRSSFDLSHGVKTTFRAGVLVPLYVDEALPGDTFTVKMHTFARLATQLHPIMDNMYIDIHYWAIPYRLVWDNWAHFCGAEDDPGDSLSNEYTIPQLVVPGGTSNINTLYDYMGIPPTATNFSMNALFTRSYNLVGNEWYRDQNLSDSKVVDRDDGPDLWSDYNLYARSKRHDYFTSCLPWPSKGPPVLLSMGDTAPLTFTSDAPVVATGDGEPTFAIASANRKLTMVSGSTNTLWTSGSDATDDAAWDDPKLEADMSSVTGTADLSSATAQTINEIRQAFQIQKLYERDARGGTRLIETIKAHFGVTSPDARMQRPEFLGGSTQQINSTPVPRTTGTVGELGAYVTTGSSDRGFTHSFTEHCVVMALASLRADLSYQSGVHRMFTRKTRWDFYWPALAHIGEQAVRNDEIYALGDTAPGPTDDELTFGYQERWAEYRSRHNRVCGTFRSDAVTSIDPWHLSQDFTELPVLGESFIHEKPPIDRIVAVAGDDVLMDAYIEINCVRPMPAYSVPGLMDHF